MAIPHSMVIMPRCVEIGTIVLSLMMWASMLVVMRVRVLVYKSNNEGNIYSMRSRI